MLREGRFIVGTDAMVRVDPAAEVHGVRIPSVLRSGLTISFMKLMLRVCGFGRTIKWIRTRVVGVPATTVVNVALVRRAEHAVAMAGAWYPGRALCLEQSLALYYLLRRQGVPVKYCPGVRPYPFGAHAWVEYRGEPVNDVAEHVSWYTRMPGQLP
jgi:hypothetical protein